jgi:hypothetical protein
MKVIARPSSEIGRYAGATARTCRPPHDPVIRVAVAQAHPRFVRLVLPDQFNLNRRELAFLPERVPSLAQFILAVSRAVRTLSPRHERRQERQWENHAMHAARIRIT